MLTQNISIDKITITLIVFIVLKSAQHTEKKFATNNTVFQELNRAFQKRFLLETRKKLLLKNA